MSMFRSLEASASALTATRLQMDLIANNLANINTTRTADGGPYRRRYAVQTERHVPFSGVLNQALSAAGQPAPTGEGVRVVQIAEDQSPFKLKYDPANPDADASGMVRLPNVDLLQEMTDMIVATRVYEANVTAFNAGKSMAQRALEIGR